MQLEEDNEEGKSMISQANGNPVLKNYSGKQLDEFNFPQRGSLIGKSNNIVLSKTATGI